MHKHVGPQAPGPHGQQKGGDFATQPGGTVGRGSGTRHWTWAWCWPPTGAPRTGAGLGQCSPETSDPASAPDVPCGPRGPLCGTSAPPASRTHPGCQPRLPPAPPGGTLTTPRWACGSSRWPGFRDRLPPDQGVPRPQPGLRRHGAQGAPRGGRAPPLCRAVPSSSGRAPAPPTRPRASGRGRLREPQQLLSHVAPPLT